MDAALEPQSGNLLGPWMTMALVVGSMIGAGIFLLPRDLAPLGWNAPLGWVISGTGAVCLAISFGWLAQGEGPGGDPAGAGGGIQAHIERALGANAAFLATWGFWTGTVVSNAAVAIGVATTLTALSPGFAAAWGSWLAVGCLVGFTAVAIMGTRDSGRVQILTTAIKLLPLALVMALPLWKLAAHAPLQPVAGVPLGFGGLAKATTLTLFALTGFENAVAPVDKIANPARNLPRALIGGAAFVAVLYMACSTAVGLLLSAGGTAAAASPYAAAIAGVLGPAAGALTIACIAISAAGCLNGGVLATGELGYSMGLRGQLPGAFARTRVGGIPAASLVINAVLSIALVLANASRGLAGLFTFALLLSTVATLVLYVAGALAALKQTRGTGRRAVIMGGLMFAAFAIYGAGLEADGWGLVLMLIGLAVRWGLARRVPVTECQ